MLRVSIQVLCIFIKSIIVYVFHLRTLDEPLYFASECLLKKVSYRLTKEDSNSSLLALRVLKRTFVEILKTDQGVTKFESNSIGLYNAFFETVTVFPWVEKMSSQKMGYFIDKSKVLSVAGFGKKCILFSFVFLVFCLVFLPSLFSSRRRRINYSLLITEIPECIALMFHLSKNNIQTLYYLTIPEIDANFVAYILMKNDVQVNKISVSNSLSLSNRITITNSLILSFAYQNEELKYLRETMVYDKVENWIPYSCFCYLDKYLKKPIVTNENTIGFYSSAGYLRMYLGDNGTEELLRNEEALLSNLAIFLAARNDVHLTIFLHPLEKKNPENYAVSMEYYNTIFPNIKFSYNQREFSTMESLDKVNLAISIYSTVSFERLFFGFKALFFNADIKDFPLEGTRLNNICAKTKDELFILINKNLILTEYAFFADNNIEDYSYNSKVYAKYLPNL